MHNCARAALLIVLVGLATPAHAQIYTWHDANGHLVLSDHRPPGEIAAVQTYAVPNTSTIRATRPTASLRARPYEDLIRQHAELRAVRPDLVRAVMQVESGFNRFARSPKGALGLMQLMPATIRQYGVVDPFNPADNVRAGVAYLRDLLDRYENDETLALAAYNAGPGAVDKNGQRVPPYRETQNYVAQIDRMAGRTIGRRDGRIYKVTEIIDGRPVVRYTDKRPTTGTFEVVAR